MKSSFKFTVAAVGFILASGSAMAVPLPGAPAAPALPRAAPAPEIGEGVAGAAAASIMLLAFLLYPRMRKRQSS
jgi:hypothetical protein